MSLNYIAKFFTYKKKILKEYLYLFTIKYNKIETNLIKIR